MAKNKLNKYNHEVHKYQRIKFSSGTFAYKCMLAGCTHWILEPLIVGRFSICCRCDSTFLITDRSLTAKKMHCEKCTRGRYNKPKEINKEFDLDSFLAGLLPEKEVEGQIPEEVLEEITEQDSIRSETNE